MVILRDNRLWLQVAVPANLRRHYGGAALIEQDLCTDDPEECRERSEVFRALLRSEFADRARGSAPSAARLRRTYQDHLKENATGASKLGDSSEIFPLPNALLRPRAGDTTGSPSSEERVRSAGGSARTPSTHRNYAATDVPCPEPPFSQVAADYMRQWKARADRKPTNTENQKRATYRLFQGFWADAPLSGITGVDAAGFHDAIRLLHPHWARASGAHTLTWETLLASHGSCERGLSDATVNRHMAALQSLWEWARRRGHCTGDNPFADFHTRLRAGVNVTPYRAWETDELNVLLTPPPRRRDLLEVVLVGMYSGMRLDEIASLTWGRIREAEGVVHFEVTDAKTPAGNRQVPVHSALQWLLARREADDVRVWSTFNLEGPGKKAGADAGREFSRYKASRGFTARTKAFHSFRKSVTRIMERAGIAETEWAQVLGHERGFTYRVYNPDGITLRRKAELIELIAYPGVNLPSQFTDNLSDELPEVWCS